MEALLSLIYHLCGGLQHSWYLAIGARVFFYLEVLTHIVGHVNQEYLADQGIV